MSVTTTTHLNFRGDARTALEFYQSVFGGHLAVVTYKDADAVQEESEADQVMWGQVLAENGFHVMAYDVPSRMGYDQGENSFFVSLRGETVEEVTGYWEKLADGATVVVPVGRRAGLPPTECCGTVSASSGSSTSSPNTNEDAPSRPHRNPGQLLLSRHHDVRPGGESRP